MKITIYIFIIFIALFGLFINPLFCEQQPNLIVFYSDTCSKCLRLIREFMPRVEEKYEDKIDIRYLNIDHIENYRLLLSYEEKFDKTEKSLPILFMQGRFLSSESQIKKGLGGFILEALSKQGLSAKEVLPRVNLIDRFKSFSLLAIISAGLIDGINPCAFTVIVFFMTFLAFQKFGKREIIVTGLCFIFAVFLTYLLLGLGLFRVLYSLRRFYFVSRLIYILIALMAFALGILSIYDIFKFKRSRKTEDMILALPQRLKYYIHYIIGLRFRQGQKDSRNHSGMPKLIISAFLCGSFISLLEAVCTGQVYLPTLTFVLKISDLKVKALMYLILYNLMFIIPLLAVFLFALFGATSFHFSNFMRKHIVTIKMLMAILFFGLGLILIYKV